MSFVFIVVVPSHTSVVIARWIGYGETGVGSMWYSRVRHWNDAADTKTKVYADNKRVCARAQTSARRTCNKYMYAYFFRALRRLLLLRYITWDTAAAYVRFTEERIKIVFTLTRLKSASVTRSLYPLPSRRRRIVIIKRTYDSSVTRRTRVIHLRPQWIVVVVTRRDFLTYTVSRPSRTVEEKYPPETRTETTFFRSPFSLFRSLPLLLFMRSQRVLVAGVTLFFKCAIDFARALHATLRLFVYIQINIMYSSTTTIDSHFSVFYYCVYYICTIIITCISLFFCRFYTLRSGPPFPPRSAVYHRTTVFRSCSLRSLRGVGSRRVRRHPPGRDLFPSYFTDFIYRFKKAVLPDRKPSLSCLNNPLQR